MGVTLLSALKSKWMGTTALGLAQEFMAVAWAMKRLDEIAYASGVEYRQRLNRKHG